MQTPQPQRASRALYDELRGRIEEGTFTPGMPMPSTRSLAAERGVSRTTVTLVYEQLAADGFIDTQPGAVSRVAHGLQTVHGAVAPAGRASDAGAGTAVKRRLSRGGGRLAGLPLPALASPAALDFVYGPLSGLDFPARAWGQAQRAVAQRRPDRLAYGDPLGDLSLRQALLAWAQACGAWVIEDDYDGEYRHAVRPEPSLRELDGTDGVLHIGTFSKTLSPELRLGYLVLPTALAAAFAAAKRLADRHTASAGQQVLAQLLASGSYDRHLRRIRRLQRGRQQALLAALSRHLGAAAQVQGAASGLHVVVWFPGLHQDQEAALVDAAAAEQVRVYPVSRFDVPGQDVSARPAGLVMGYAVLDEAQIEAGVRRLARACERLQVAAPSRD